MAAHIAIIKSGLEGHLLPGILAKVDFVLGPRYVTPIVGGSVDVANGTVPDGGNLGIGKLNNLRKCCFPTIVERSHHCPTDDHVDK